MRKTVKHLRENEEKRNSKFSVINTEQAWLPITKLFSWKERITEKAANSRELFTNTDQLLNTAPLLPQSSEAKYAELVLLFYNKINSVRVRIASGLKTDDPWYNHGMKYTIRQVIYAKLSRCNSTALCIDSEPTAFFKQVFNGISSHVLNIINKSLGTLIFPGAFRTADVKPLLKKPNLDSNILTNHRFISSLLFISKIVSKDSKW